MAVVPICRFLGSAPCSRFAHITWRRILGRGSCVCARAAPRVGPTKAVSSRAFLGRGGGIFSVHSSQDRSKELCIIFMFCGKISIFSKKCTTKTSFLIDEADRPLQQESSLFLRPKTFDSGVEYPVEYPETSACVSGDPGENS